MLKVRDTTDPVKLAKAIKSALEESSEVEISAIGEKQNYTVTKAIVQAGTWLGYRLPRETYAQNVELRKGTKTAYIHVVNR